MYEIKFMNPLRPRNLLAILMGWAAIMIWVYTPIDWGIYDPLNPYHKLVRVAVGASFALLSALLFKYDENEEKGDDCSKYVEPIFDASDSGDDSVSS